ncbi:MAG: hypothetical protein WCT23_10380 [Candidatus Neomarinimicrobiota bacterium]
MDKSDIEVIRRELNTILGAYGTKKGIQFQLGSITYSSNQFGCRLTATSGTTTEDVDKVNWNKNCRRFGFTPEEFGKTVKFNGSNYRLVGIKPRSHRYPIVVEHTGNHRRFKLTEYTVKNLEVVSC